MSWVWEGEPDGKEIFENTGVDEGKINIDIQENWCEGEDVLSVLFKDTPVCQIYGASTIDIWMILEH